MAEIGCRFLLVGDLQSDPAPMFRAHQTNADAVTAHAYEIPGTHFGQFAPKQTMLSRAASETIQSLGGRTFVFDWLVAVHDRVIEELTPAVSGEFPCLQGEVRVRARSHGPALLVLPVQFSNSFQIASTALNKKVAPIQFLRVHLFKKGVLFDGEMDFKFAHVFGPFRASTVRLRGLEGCARLGVKELGGFPNRPNYLSLAWKRDITRNN